MPLQRHMMLAALFLIGTSPALTAEIKDCDPTLVVETAKSNFADSEKVAASRLITKDNYDNFKTEASGKALVDEVPVGGSFSDFRSHREKQLSSSSDSRDSAVLRGELRTWLSIEGVKAYEQCLETVEKSSIGFHAWISNPNKDSLTLHMLWNMGTLTDVGTLTDAYFSGVTQAPPVPRTWVPNATQGFPLTRTAADFKFVANMNGMTTEVFLPAYRPPPIQPEPLSMAFLQGVWCANGRQFVQFSSVSLKAAQVDGMGGLGGFPQRGQAEISREGDSWTMTTKLGGIGLASGWHRTSDTAIVLDYFEEPVGLGAAAHATRSSKTNTALKRCS
ncbi:MAG TPA: hypothetical protein VKQ27_16800 [Acetobacteraceae bacterium]|nr:hypothetical protein [Acetobacteraceae bacterium]